MNEDTVYCIFDSDTGDIVGFRFYKAYDVAESYRLAYWPENTYVSRVIVEQDRS